MVELRSMKRRAGVAEERLLIKKERLDGAEQELEEEHRTFTAFSKRLEEKWEQRFDALARLARHAGVRHEDIEAVRLQPWQTAAHVQQATTATERVTAAEQEARQAAVEEEAAAERAARQAVRMERVAGSVQEQQTTTAAEGEAVTMRDAAARCQAAAARKAEAREAFAEHQAALERAEEVALRVAERSRRRRRSLPLDYEHLVGKVVEVYSEGEGKWFSGEVKEYDGETISWVVRAGKNYRVQARR